MASSNFLFVSWSGLITDIAWQVAKEGHAVKYYIRSASDRDIGDGFVPKVDEWESHVDWADVIVFDDTLGQGELAASLRARGQRVVGGSAYTDSREDDRSFGQEELKKAGVNILQYREFRDFDSAIDYVKTNPDRYVIKPLGGSGQCEAPAVRGGRRRRPGCDSGAGSLSQIVSRSDQGLPASAPSDGR